MTSNWRTLLLRQLVGLQIVGCCALTKDVVYTLNKDEQDALGNITAFNANELKELRSSLLPWLHDMANAFSKKAVDTLS